MSREPVLRATSESGDVILDPSEDALFMMFEDLEAGDSTYLIVESLTDATGQTYAQSARNDDGTYIVEYRDGRPDRHFGADAQDMRTAHSLIAGWACEIPGWREDVTWRPVSF
ncbi:hypothetical protein [Aeromicrobium choanae]|uniref:Immunity protein Imm1 n=1 Tax=Aeromicrobium choanae TaxID=1736691 RepID=A0A1T4YPJ7_9ACTN|nr:hypothetical protein [Aeromicrobium choanae]SKB03613.1 hypothetical protein SAMN06295964_0294 [Aeromicrobium choanae]